MHLVCVNKNLIQDRRSFDSKMAGKISESSVSAEWNIEKSCASAECPTGVVHKCVFEDVWHA